MFEPGRICIKIAGREAKKLCCVVEKIDDQFVLIDGNVRRKKCNIKHLEPLDKVIKLPKSASTEKIKELLKKEGFEIEKKGKKRESKEKPKRKRKVKVKKEEKPKEVKKETQKEIKKDAKTEKTK